MAENSKIEWTDHTFNPWIGCTKVSDGCKNCYAEQMMDKRYGRVQWGPQGMRVRASPANWRKPLAWNKQAAKEGRRFRVFCASLADVFEDKPDQPEMDVWRYHLLHLIGLTENLDWLLLTKRPESVQRMIDRAHDEEGQKWSNGIGRWSGMLPPNVWLGTSVENQEQANKRIPELLKIPAAVRFLSMEPLLGAVDLQDIPDGDSFIDCLASNKAAIDWVIVGGESGPNARPMHPNWARSIRDQCVGAGVPFFFKQWGEWCPYDKEEHQEWADGKSGGDVDRWRWMRIDGSNGVLWKKEHVTTMIKIGKKEAGRLLDGREWNQYPQLDQNGQPMA